MHGMIGNGEYLTQRMPYIYIYVMDFSDCMTMSVMIDGDVVAFVVLQLQ